MPDQPFYLTTLCYIEKDDAYLMLHRTKKEHDINKGKWIGVGGKFEPDETPEECLLREVKEETGLTLTSFRLRGIITFLNDAWPTEYMFLYTADAFTGTLTPLRDAHLLSTYRKFLPGTSGDRLFACNEGNLAWIPKKDLMKLNLWEGDKLFLKLLTEDSDMFSLKVRYHGDNLEEAVLHLHNRPTITDV